MKTTPLRLALLSCLLLAPTAAWAVIDVDAGPDVTLECESADGAEYTLNGSAPDLEGIEFSWSTVPDVDLKEADTLTPTGVFPIGDTVATLDAQTATDSGSDDTTVTVEDTTPPVVRAKAKPYFLWPPNHEMKQVEVKLYIRDRCTDDDDDFDVELISATSNEPDNGTGDGNTINDIQDADIGTDDRHVLLRAERKGNGDGRIYTLRYRVTDPAGNSTEAQARVYVPHDASDLKDLIDEMGGHRDDLEPICPLPRDAAEEFVDALPPAGLFPNARACQTGCKTWARGCTGVVRGAGQCVQAEFRSLMAIESLICRQDPDRTRSRACQSDIRALQSGARTEQRSAYNQGAEICRETAADCSQSCDDYFGVEEYVE